MNSKPRRRVRKRRWTKRGPQRHDAVRRAILAWWRNAGSEARYYREDKIWYDLIKLPDGKEYNALIIDDPVKPNEVV